MNVMLRLIRMLLNLWNMRSSRDRVYVMPRSQAHSTHDDSLEHGQRERHSYAFQSVRAGDTVTNSCETWTRDGDLLDGNTTELRVITASGRVVESAEHIVTICSFCGLGEDVEIRSDISQRSLCRTCARQFQKPNGEIITVCPDEQNILLESQDTWAMHDFKNL